MVLEADDLLFKDYITKQKYEWAKARLEQKKQAKKHQKKIEIKKVIAKTRLKRLLNEQERNEKRLAKLEHKQKIEQELAPLGFRKGYTKANILKRTPKSRNLELCKEIYEKAKSGVTTRELCIQYNRGYTWVFRHKYEYNLYLNMLEKAQQEQTNTQPTTN
jgi:hypothetical protein